MSTLDLFGEKPFRFDGDCGLELLADSIRLNTQLDRVKALMSDGSFRTLSEIAARVPGSEAALSARLRDLRKVGMTVERRRRGNASLGLFEYRCSK